MIRQLYGHESGAVDNDSPEIIFKKRITALPKGSDSPAC